jgi:hypothetical protein
VDQVITFVSMTYNLWGDSYAEQRAPALQALLETRPPDLLATQELRAWSRDLIDATLVEHERVHDSGAGWERQSNLWWRRDMFTAIDSGWSDVGILSTGAGLFWVRLLPYSAEAPELVFSTAHLTWPGHPDEQVDRINRRTQQAQAIVAELDRLAGDAACLFTVDINDIGAPLWALGHAGFADSFTSLGRVSPPTHPVEPIPHRPNAGTPQSPLESPSKAIDWQFARGPLQARSSEVVEFFFQGHAPSDHRPVVSTFTLGGPVGSAHSNSHPSLDEERT